MIASFQAFQALPKPESPRHPLQASSDGGSLSPMCSVLCGCDRGGAAEEPGWTTEYPAGVQSKGPGESPGGRKSEKSVLCEFVSSHSKRPVPCSWRVGGLPHVGQGLRPLPERSTPLAPPSADGGGGGSIARHPTTPSCSRPPGFPADTLQLLFAHTSQQNGLISVTFVDVEEEGFVTVTVTLQWAGPSHGT